MKVSKGWVTVFLSYIEAATSVKSHVLSQFKKSVMIFTNFSIFDFDSGLSKTERSYDVQKRDIPALIYDLETRGRHFDALFNIL